MPEALSDGQPKGGLGEEALKPLDGGLLRGQSERLLSVVGKPGEEVEPFVLRKVALGNIHEFGVSGLAEEASRQQLGEDAVGDGGVPAGLDQCRRAEEDEILGSVLGGLEEELGGVEGAGGEERADLRRHDDDGLGRRGECPLELETKLKPFGSVTSYIPQES